MTLNEAVAENRPLVQRIARVIWSTLPPASVELDDLIQCGMLGLMSAFERYEPTQGATFATYASRRIRGAILDELRAQDWMPRLERRRIRRTRAKVAVIEAEHGKLPAIEIATRLEISIEEYRATETASSHGIVSDEALSLDDLRTHDAALSTMYGEPLAAMTDTAQRAELAACISSLPEHHKRILDLYYSQELTLREIGVLFGLTESRICQIHGAIVKKLRKSLG